MHECRSCRLLRHHAGGGLAADVIPLPSLCRCCHALDSSNKCLHGAGEDGTFAAGAFDSLSAVELSSNLSSQLGLQLPGTLAFDYPSVMAMATHLHNLLAPEASALSSSARAVVLAGGTGLPQQGLQADVVQVRRQTAYSNVRTDTMLICKSCIAPAQHTGHQAHCEVVACFHPGRFNSPAGHQSRTISQRSPQVAWMPSGRSRIRVGTWTQCSTR